MGRDRLRQWVNILAIGTMIAFNVLASIFAINGQTTGEIAAQFNTTLMPADYTFSIWGLIYFGLIVFGAFQALPSQRVNPRLRRTGFLFAASCLANMAWLVLWHFEYFPFALVAIFTLLLLLVVVHRRLAIGRELVPSMERWCVQMVIGAYLAWISVATISNVSIVLAMLNWDRWNQSPETWTLVILLMAAILAIGLLLFRGDVAFVLVMIWAFAGIAVRNQGNWLVLAGTILLTFFVIHALAFGYVYHKDIFRNQLGSGEIPPNDSVATKST